MDKYLMALIKDNTPKMNYDVVNGYSTLKLKGAPDYINRIFKWAYTSMEAFCGVRYEGYEICTPREEFNFVTKPRQSRRSVNIGESSLYMVKFFFTYRGEKLDPIFLYLPFCEDGNIMYLGGTRYFLFPVLSNKIISATREGIFIKILKDKKNFTREYYNIFLNGERYHEGIIKSPLYDSKMRRSKIDDTTKAQPTNVHYLLSKYGFSEFWKHFYGWVPRVETTETLNTSKIDTEKYYIFESTKIKPRGYLDPNYIPTNIIFIIPIEKVTHDVINTIVTMYYIIDHFPDELKLQYINKPYVWTLTLGYINFSSKYKTQDLITKMAEHFASLNDTMDELLKSKLTEIGYICNDIYDLLFYIKRDFALWHSKGETISSMYGKELDVLESTLANIVSAIFTSSYEIKKKISSKKELSKNEIYEILSQKIRTGLVFKLTSTDENNRSNMSTMSYSGDNKFFKITSSIIPQEGRKSHRGAKISLDDPNNKLHASYAECGGYLAIVKPQPIGNGKINPYVTIDDNGTIIHNPDFINVITDTQKKISDH